jgi:hypothetical protein
VRADVRHGVLEIHIPKHSAQERSRRIQVRGEDAQSGAGGTAMTQAVAGGGSSERAKSDAAAAAASSGKAAAANEQSASSPTSTTTTSGR